MDAGLVDGFDGLARTFLCLLVLCSMMSLLAALGYATVNDHPSGNQTPTGPAIHVAQSQPVYLPADSDWPDGFCDRRGWRRFRVSARRRGPRSREEIEKERRELYERTCREVDLIVAEYHARLPRSAAKSIGAIYARYSTRFQDSVADQVRGILEDAVRLGIFIPREMIFFDLAVRGYKKHRVGLDQLREVLRKKQVGVLLLFATNRLFRKTYRTLEFVDQVHKGWGLRCIFVKSGVDTDDKRRWETLLAQQAMFDQFVVTMYVENIHGAHEGLLSKQLVFGTISYGYQGEPIPGQLTKRGKPRCKIVVDKETSEIVKRIFLWYVGDLDCTGDEPLSINEIVRKLNEDESIPLPPRCKSGEWTRLAVLRVLRNLRYRGVWQYGVTEATYVPDGDYVRQRMRAEPLQEVYLKDLDFISKDLWDRAQKRLAKEVRRRGRQPKDGDRQSRPRLLNGLFVCPEHDQILYVGGPHGRMMYCPSCNRLTEENRPLFTHLGRKTALRLTCQKLASLVVADGELVQDIIVACQREAEHAQKPNPRYLAQLLADRDRLTRSIDFTMRNPGETAEDQAESDRLLRQCRNERAGILLDIERYQAAEGESIVVPTEAEVRDLLARLGDLLVAAAEGGIDGEAAMARELIDELIDGKILLYQQGERKRGKGWLQRRFRLRLLSTAVHALLGQQPQVADEGMEVVIDYIRPKCYEDDLERAWQLYKQDVLCVEIAKELKCSKSKVTQLLKLAARKYGEELPDGRSRRGRLPKSQTETPLYRRIAADVATHVGEGLSDEAIARKFNTTGETIRKALRFHCRKHGLPIPTRKERRAALMRRAKERYDQGELIGVIAAEYGWSLRRMTLALRRYFADLGLTLPDGRTRRANLQGNNDADQNCGPNDERSG